MGDTLTRARAAEGDPVLYERVLSVKHWNDRLFSFTTTRSRAFRFENGQFVMIGLMVGGRALMRAYSVVSPNYEDHLEFLSIKVPNGPLTSRLQGLRVGDTLLIGRKPTGTLLLADLRSGCNLYLLCTGTGLAPFMSLLHAPEAYERFDRIVVAHGVRRVSDLAYRDYLTRHLLSHPLLGEFARQKLTYFPLVTREPFPRQGRLTDLVASGELEREVGLLPLDPSRDRLMICGNMAMLEALCAWLDARGFQMAPGYGVQGDYVVERAFVTR